MTDTSAPSPFDLHGRCAVVTGASRGIGRAIALGLSRAGAEVVLVGRPGSNDDTREAVVALGGKVDVVDLDMGDLAAVERVGAELAASRQVDIAVNNAGTIDRQDTVDLVRGGLAARPRRQPQRRVPPVPGSSVGRWSSAAAARSSSIASLLSFQGGIRVASYAASKHAVAGVTKALANEWGPHGVQVNAIAPGYISTDNTTALREDPDRSRSILERIPAGRWGSADDIAGAAVFLSSSASDYVNGHVLVVDGGWMAR